MKNLTIIAASALLFSCSTSNKTSIKSESKADSTGLISAIVKDVKKKDSTGQTKTENSQSKSVDSNYKKITVVKELFSDEFDFGDDPLTVIDPNDYFTKDTPAIKKPAKAKGLLYRETTTTETGNLKKQDSNQETKEQKTNLQAVDSSGKEDLQSSDVKKSVTVAETVKTKSKWLQGLGIGAAIAISLLLIFLYRKYKKQISV